MLIGSLVMVGRIGLKYATAMTNHHEGIRPTAGANVAKPWAPLSGWCLQEVFQLVYIKNNYK